MYLRSFASRLTGIDIVIGSGAFLLALFAMLYARERIILTDTAVYFYSCVENRTFYASGRYVAVFSQLLPLAGVLAGLSLRTVLLLYSFNLILIPLAGIALCLRVFRSRGTALSILLFYILMGMSTFYYPVSEFQMGLCFLLVYHAFLLWYFRQGTRKKAVFYGVGLFMVPTIVYAHPLSQYVFIAWLLWFLLSHPQARKAMMLFPLLLSIAAQFFFSKVMVAQVAYDDSRKSLLQNFKAPPASYFTGLLAKGSLDSFRNDYFAVAVLILLLLVFLLRSRKWLQLLVFAGFLSAFWLLVTVSFKDWSYNFYTEHLYQPLPFFIALVAGQYYKEVFFSKKMAAWGFGILCVLAFAKINGNHRFFERRLDWYSACMQQMRARNVDHAVVSPAYLPQGNKDYWACFCETMLLSSLAAPDSSMALVVDGNLAKLNGNLEKEQPVRTPYFTRTVNPFVSLDSLAGPAVLLQLQQEHE